MALTEWEIWACALKVEQMHGERAGDHVYERVKALAEAGDHDGVAAWLAIADRLYAMQRGDEAPH